MSSDLSENKVLKKVLHYFSTLRYLNKGLSIMSNERDSVRIALEAILLLLYAWNSCPVPGNDISRSLVAVGREFAFPIDYFDHNALVYHLIPSEYFFGAGAYRPDETARFKDGKLSPRKGGLKEHSS